MVKEVREVREREIKEISEIKERETQKTCRVGARRSGGSAEYVQSGAFRYKIAPSIARISAPMVG